MPTVMCRKQEFKWAVHKKSILSDTLCITRTQDSGPSKVKHNPFQEAVRLSICSTFELKWHEPHDAVQCRVHGLTFEFLFEFQTEFFSNFLFEFQVVREPNRSTFEGPLYLVPESQGYGLPECDIMQSGRKAPMFTP
jgi:hypothetical protein